MPARLAAPSWLTLRHRRPDSAVARVALTAALALLGAWGWQDAEWSDLLPARRLAPSQSSPQAPAAGASFSTAPALRTAAKP